VPSKQAIDAAWQANAEHWLKAVEGDLIPTRREGTNQAIVDAICALKPTNMLDMGCGEGWLIREATRRHPCDALGVDASPLLIDKARKADPQHTYLHLSYDNIVQSPAQLRGNFDVVVFNYALFEKDLTPLLTCCREVLAPSGQLVIQTLHPDNGPETTEGWQVENFKQFENENWHPMPWYYRSFQAWKKLFNHTGLRLKEIHEPKNLQGETLSVIFILTAA